MRLIEKKCPNCGANLEFDENAKSCHCTYCKRSFEIERDLNDVDKFNLIYEKIHKPFKAIFIIPFVFAAVIFLIILFSIIFGFRSTSRSMEEEFNEKSTEIKEKINEGEKIIKDASELTTENMDAIDRHCSSLLHQSTVGRSDTTYSYQTTGDPRLVKTYVAYKKDTNYIISIYSVIYHNFFNQSDQQTVYVPAVIENVKKSTSFMTKAKNPAPEYYLNEDHSTYIYAYASAEDAYNGVVKPYEEDGYKISEK